MGFWRFSWWRDENNRAGATSLANVLKVVIPAIVVVVLALAGWLGFQTTDAPAPKPTIQTGDNSAVQTGSGTQINQRDQGTVIIGMSIEQHEAILMRREKELRADLERASTAEKALIGQELDAVEAAMFDLESSYRTALEDLRKLRLELAGLQGSVSQEQLDAAQQALFEGDRSNADALLAEVEEQAAETVKLAADAAYLRGEIAEQEIRWHDAAEHYSRAARLQPSFDRLMKAGTFMQRDGRYKEAIRFDEDLVSFAQREFGKSTSHTATALNNLAESLRVAGEYARAEEILIRVLEIDRETIGTRHTNYATHLNNLANAIWAQHRYAEAETLYREALEIDRVTTGERSSGYAINLNNLANALEGQGRYPEAEEIHRQALEISREVFGEAHPYYAAQLNNLALAIRKQDRNAEAEKLLRQARDISRSAVGEHHPDYAIRLSNLAGAVRAQGRQAEAEGLYRKALEIFDAAVGGDHPHTQTVRRILDDLSVEEAE